MLSRNKTKVIAEEGKQELFIIREFEAPRELLFRAFSEAELLQQWLGPQELSMKIDRYSNESGGSYRFLHCTATGQEFAFNGVMHEVCAPERIIRTFEFEGLPERGHVSLEIASFDSLPGDRSRITIQSIFKSVADRDGMVKSGMERGVNDSYEKLDELISKLV